MLEQLIGRVSDLGALNTDMNVVWCDLGEICLYLTIDHFTWGWGWLFRRY